MITLQDAYTQARQPRFSPYNDRKAYISSAKSALQQARYALDADKTRAEWHELGGDYIDNWQETERGGTFPDKVRIVAHPDGWCDLDDLLGDTFNSDVNTDIKPEILERERQHEIDRISNDGVWCLVAEYWDGEEWQCADSVGGFIGNDFSTSGYEPDLMRSAINAYRQSILDRYQG